MNKKEITSEKFNEILLLLVEKTPTNILIGIPGIYEILSEHFNNDVLFSFENDIVIDVSIKYYECLQRNIKNQYCSHRYIKTNQNIEELINKYEIYVEISEKQYDSAQNFYKVSFIE